MPRGDRTGPTSAGPMTGRGAGFCEGGDDSGCARGQGRARRQGGRGGHGRRNMFHATGLTGRQRAAANVAEVSSSESEKSILEKEIAAMQSQLDSVKERLERINATER